MYLHQQDPTLRPTLSVSEISNFLGDVKTLQSQFFETVDILVLPMLAYENICTNIESRF